MADANELKQFAERDDTRIAELTEALNAVLESLDAGGEQSRAFADEIAAIKAVLTHAPDHAPDTPPAYTVLLREPDGDGDPLNDFYRWSGAAVSAEEAAKAAIINRMSRDLETTGDDGETILAVVGVFLGADLTPLG